ncbi:MAG TPA: hypothetical protein VHG51_02915, partial [Longimicrobiaceae bacterium]|nr:hypothetical protein [Longimicrobiaceae bacterium]
SLHDEHPFSVQRLVPPETGLSPGAAAGGEAGAHAQASADASRGRRARCRDRMGLRMAFGIGRGLEVDDCYRLASGPAPGNTGPPVSRKIGSDA